MLLDIAPYLLSRQSNPSQHSPRPHSPGDRLAGTLDSQVPWTRPGLRCAATKALWINMWVYRRAKAKAAQTPKRRHGQHRKGSNMYSIPENGVSNFVCMFPGKKKKRKRKRKKAHERALHVIWVCMLCCRTPRSRISPPDVQRHF